VLAGQWMAETHRGRYYAKAQNLARTATAAYDEVLAGHDLLVMPTLPLKATELPEPGCPVEVYVARTATPTRPPSCAPPTPSNARCSAPTRRRGPLPPLHQGSQVKRGKRHPDR
jgi:hypothetical protein